MLSVISDVPVPNQSPGLKSTQMTLTQGAGEQWWWVRENFFRDPYDAILLCPPIQEKIGLEQLKLMKLGLQQASLSSLEANVRCPYWGLSSLLPPCFMGPSGMQLGQRCFLLCQSAWQAAKEFKSLWVVQPAAPSPAQLQAGGISAPLPQLPTFQSRGDRGMC